MHFASVTDAAAVSDALTTHLSAVATIVDALLAEEVIRTLPAELRTAYWVNPRTTAAARWGDLAVNSIVEIEGRVFGATAAGIVELTPEEGTVDARIVWDLLDLGVAEQKVVQGAYVAGQSAAPFAITATTKQGSWEYTTHRTDGSEQSDNHYTPLGRGLLSRFYRFEMANTDGAPFSVDDVRVLMGATQRRRGGS